MDDLQDRLAGVAEQAAAGARSPGAAVTLRRARARRRRAAGGAATALLLLLGLVTLTPRLAGRDTVSRPPRPVPAAREVTPLWTVQAAAPEPVTPAEGGPQAAGDLVVVSTGFHEPGRVRAYDARTGSLRWVHQTGRTAFVRAVGERHVIVAPQYGALVALDRASGRERWRLPLASDQSPELATIAGERLYVGTSFPTEGAVDPPIVYALDLATGRQRWRAVLDPGTDLQWGAPVVAQGLVLLADTPSHSGSAPTSHLHALDADTGQVRWTADLGTGEQAFHTQRPLLVDGRIYAVAPSGVLLALDAGSGRPFWQQRRGPILPLLVGASGSLVFAVMEGSLVALDAGTGDQRWQIPVGAGERWALLAGETIYLAAEGYLAAVDASTGRERWRSRIGQPVGPPARLGDRAYVATRDRLVALNGPSGSVRWVSSEREIASGPITTPAAVVVAARDGALLAFAP